MIGDEIFDQTESLINNETIEFEMKKIKAKQELLLNIQELATVFRKIDGAKTNVEFQKIISENSEDDIEEKNEEEIEEKNEDDISSKKIKLSIGGNKLIDNPKENITESTGINIEKENENYYDGEQAPQKIKLGLLKK